LHPAIQLVRPFLGQALRPRVARRRRDTTPARPLLYTETPLPPPPGISYITITQITAPIPEPSAQPARRRPRRDRPRRQPPPRRTALMTTPAAASQPASWRLDRPALFPRPVYPGLRPAHAWPARCAAQLRRSPAALNAGYPMPPSPSPFPAPASSAASLPRRPPPNLLCPWPRSPLTPAPTTTTFISTPANPTASRYRSFFPFSPHAPPAAVTVPGPTATPRSGAHHDAGQPYNYNLARGSTARRRPRRPSAALGPPPRSRLLTGLSFALSHVFCPFQRSCAAWFQNDHPGPDSFRPADLRPRLMPSSTAPLRCASARALVALRGGRASFRRTGPARLVTELAGTRCMNLCPHVGLGRW